LKLNRLRNLALGLIFGAFLLMYIGVMISVKWVLPTTLVIGTLMILVSVFIYLRVGAVSMKIPTVECPRCHKLTKMWEVEDGCMYCRTPLLLEMDEEENLYAVERT
jgi:late competence protein required for DNA uptake (superfamily II DNA/RNA helicase)